ncbi:MAG: hypothetical protein ACPL6D_03785 [Thermodesulfobacteriota bacterium]
MGILDLLKGGQRGAGGPQPPTQIETRTYDELMDELETWNTQHTDILDVLRGEVEMKRLESWSDALEKGIRKNLSPPSGRKEENPLFPVFLDLYKFVKHLRVRLLTNPTMKNVKPMERSDSISACIICGIRALQKEMGAKRLIDTLQWMMLERYLG